MLLTLQNGFGNEEFLAQNFGAERVLGGLCFVCLNRLEPGVIEHYDYGRVILGEYADIRCRERMTPLGNLSALGSPARSSKIWPCNVGANSSGTFRSTGCRSWPEA